ncbi:MAG: hypothetical protein ACI9W1_001065 [Candidatus Azotimanducaceae bacterium]|jgi:hypothetical protein
MGDSNLPAFGGHSLANLKENGLDSTVAVGAYPKAASPYGLLDMPSDGHEDVNGPSDLLRCMREGGFSAEPARAKRGHRDAVNPGIETIRTVFVWFSCN